MQQKHEPLTAKILTATKVFNGLQLTWKQKNSLEQEAELIHLRMENIRRILNSFQEIAAVSQPHFLLAES